MNLVVDDAVEVNLAQKDKQGKEIPETRRQLGKVPKLMEASVANLWIGQILLKGDNVSLLQALQ